MKIGLYGGVANNLYVVAKAFAKQGLDICFIRDRADRYPFSQPVWEDISCTLDYDQLASMTNWSWSQWEEWETGLGWQAPAWLIDPLLISNSHEFTIHRSLGSVDKMILHFMSKKRSHWPAVLHCMAACDVLLVCGIDGSLLAFMSGKPFVILPHGHDLRTAAGLHPPTSHYFYGLLSHWALLRVLRKAYQKALWIGTHDPSLLGGEVGNVLPKLETVEFKPFHIPLPIREHHRKGKRLDVLTKLIEPLRLKIPQTDYIGFIPSRVDFFWKGHDRIFRALSQVPHKEKMHLIVLGWGQNYYDAREMTREMKLGRYVTFLPCALSKPLLYEVFKAVDFVLDQFQLGVYGTSALEAMSCGTPVVIFMEEEPFRRRGWGVPPVLNAKNEKEIAGILEGILLGDIDLETYGSTAQDWVKRTHSEELATISFLKEIQNDLFTSSTSFRTLLKNQTCTD